MALLLGENLEITTSICSADEKFDGTYPTNVVVTNEGHCTYIPPGIFKSTCLIDITWFPFDDQNCEMKFGSWTYNGFKVNLRRICAPGSKVLNPAVHSIPSSPNLSARPAACGRKQTLHAAEVTSFWVNFGWNSFPLNMFEDVYIP
jgi:hypothetical protein